MPSATPSDVALQAERIEIVAKVMKHVLKSMDVPSLPCESNCTEVTSVPEVSLEKVKLINAIFGYEIT